MSYDGLPEGPYWITELPRGVELYVAPCDTVVYETARAKMTRIVAGVDQQIKDAAEIGAKLEGLPDLSDPDRRAGFSQALFMTALAQAGILDWRGTKTPPPPDAKDREAALAKMMRDPALAEAFLIRYTSPYAALVAEGNALPSAPDTSGARAANTATAV